MLVGDFCPRALDPIYEMIEAERELELAAHSLGDAHGEIHAELPCDMFGTNDRCDGAVCYHDGHCFSGCCSLVNEIDEMRCMPLVGGDMCPIALDVIEEQDVTPILEEREVEHDEEIEEMEEDYDSPMHHMDHKEEAFAEDFEQVADEIPLDYDPEDTPLHHIDHKEMFEDEDDSPMHHMDHKEEHFDVF